MSAIIRFSGASSAELFDDSATGFRAGVLVRKGAASERRRTERHLLLVLSEGEATVVVGEDRHPIGTHQGIVLPVDTDFDWVQEASTVVYYAALGEPVAARGPGEGAVPIRPGELGELDVSAPPPRAFLRGAIPDQLGKQAFVDRTGQWSAGYWQSTGYYRITRPFPKHEFMLLLSGSMSLTCPGEEAEIFAPGDALLIPAGTVCDWDTPGMTKIYSSFVPAG